MDSSDVFGAGVRSEWLLLRPRWCRGRFWGSGSNARLVSCAAARELCANRTCSDSRALWSVTSGFPSDPWSCTHTWRLGKCPAGEMQEDGKLNASFYTVFPQKLLWKSNIFGEWSYRNYKMFGNSFARPLAGIFVERWDFINIIPRHTVTDVSGVVVLFMLPNTGWIFIPPVFLHNFKCGFGKTAMEMTKEEENHLIPIDVARLLWESVKTVSWEHLLLWKPGYCDLQSAFGINEFCSGGIPGIKIKLQRHTIV